MIGLLSSPWLQNLDSFLGGIPQTLEGVGGLSILMLAYRHLNCHQAGCWRIGRFTHGHFRLCHVHHPHVPSDGRITAEHIDEVTRRMKNHP